MTTVQRMALGGLLLVAGSTTSMAQRTSPDGPILGARPISAVGSIKIFVSTGSVRVVGWDKDSVVVRGRVPRGVKFYFSSIPAGAKIGIEESSDDTTHVACDLVIYMPRRGIVSAKTVSATVSARDVSGWIYSVSGSVEVSGAASSMEVQSMTGNIDVNVAVPWIRVASGAGRVLLRGAPEDADVSTISGTLTVEAPDMVRGQLSSVTGDIHYMGAPRAGGIFELTSHSGAVELSLPATTSAVFALSSISGQIINGLTTIRPVTAGPHSLRLSVGRGEALVTVRTFKGAIRLRQQ